MCLCAPADFHSDDIPEELAGLFGAISRGDHALIYEELDRCAGSFSAWDAFRLLNDAVDKDLTLKIFEAILERSPPVPEILSEENLSGVTGSLGLIESIARRGRDDVLALFLERGAGPNRSCGSGCTPLEAALEGESLENVELLTQHPELDTAWTPELLRLWAGANDSRPMLEACLRAIAPRFTGSEAPRSLPVPIPEEITLQLVIEAQNWPLLGRLCRERGRLSPEYGRDILRMLRVEAMSLRREDERDGCADAAAGLLENCPGLLRREENCRELLRCFLNCGEAVRKLLRPWVERLGRRRIAMDMEDWIFGGYSAFPDYWRELLPNGPVLVLDRWSVFLDILWNGELVNEWPLSAESLKHILDVCPIRGKARAGKLSPLARTVLLHGDAPLIESVFLQPGGLLAGEDPDELMDFIESKTWHPWDLDHVDESACTAIVAWLLENRPSMLQDESHCRMLLRCFLTFGEASRARLRPLVERLRDRRIAMDRVDWLRRGEDFPDYWHSLLPDGPALVIDRWSDLLFSCCDAMFWEQELPPTGILSRVLDACPIRGEGRAGQLSPTARAVLCFGDARLIESLLQQPDSLLSTEDPGAMVDYALQGDCPPANRGAVLACIRRETDYEL